ncbi:unnamed protein product [Prorocentrum cordatum]|uniref:Uncharacterized protein n=1 Tax=Prorocentrum cordatum TaxID=2364126 RepID=A0ABN9X182_9DINO|nr:unnamed protein product [Polarella glacialis]
MLPHAGPCLPCCSGAGRLPAVVVRNPFARLMAYYQRAWLGNRQKALQSVDEFPDWVESLAAAQAAGAYGELLSRGQARG